MRFQDCKNSKELKQELLKVLSNTGKNGLDNSISRLRLTEIFIGYIIRIVGLFYKI